MSDWLDTRLIGGGDLDTPAFAPEWHSFPWQKSYRGNPVFEELLRPDTLV